MFRAVALTVLAAAANPQPAHSQPIPGRIPTERIPAPKGVLTRLPGDGNQLALTIDDGTSMPVVAAFAEFCRDTGVRLTFFPNGVNRSWTDNAAILRPMVDSGQIQLGNHTWSHPRITTIGLDAVAEIILAHANLPPITHPYPRLLEIINRKGLQTVTLADVFS